MRGRAGTRIGSAHVWLVRATCRRGEFRFSALGFGLGKSRKPCGRVNCWANLSKTLTCNLKTSRTASPQRRTNARRQHAHIPGSSVIRDSNGQIEDILSKRGARVQQDCVALRTPLWISPSKSESRGVAYSTKKGKEIQMRTIPVLE